MAIIYLKHPVHGIKIASLEMEAEQDEQNGWLRYNPAAPSAPEAMPENALRLKRNYTRRPTVEPVAEGV